MTYPLPWCEALNRPYWQINRSLCRARTGWRKWQASRPMTQIIPAIDALIAQGEIA